MLFSKRAIACTGNTGELILKTLQKVAKTGVFSKTSWQPVQTEITHKIFSKGSHLHVYWEMIFFRDFEKRSNFDDFPEEFKPKLHTKLSF
jgi:hypothetical protein